MSQLVDGEWRTDADETADEDGSFRRGETTFRNWIAGSDVPDGVDAEPDERFQPEAGRYHLYVSYACPWAHRTLLARSLLGLEDAIDVSVVDPYRDEGGWQFTPEKEGCTPDKLRGGDYLRERYVEADPDATCRVTVPVLWDIEEETIVNNESREILRTLSTAFDEFGNEASLLPGPDDEATVAEVDQMITDIYEPVNNGVYRAGFATSQAAYDEAIDDLFTALDRWNDHLADRRYLVGDSLTEADICMFTTLVRFDQVYHTIPTTLSEDHRGVDDPKPEKWNRLRDYEHLLNYTRDIHQTDGVAETVNMDHICEHYASPGSPQLHTHDPDDIDLGLDEPHGRERLSARDPLDA